MNSEKILLIFVKNPLHGKVKTRLAATMGNDRALLIYEELLRHTCQQTIGVQAVRRLFYSNFVDENDGWSPDDFQKRLQLQETPDLGDRMSDAFGAAFRQAQRPCRVVIIGSDCPQLTTNIIEKAFQLLENHAFVIGPAMDGGYYLLGMSNFEPSVFQQVTWSAPTTFAETISRIAVLGASCARLETLSDVDYEEDWLKYGWAF